MTIEAYPLLWSEDPAAIADWAVGVLGVHEVWRADDGQGGQIEHVELTWGGSKISINIKTDSYADTGPSGVALAADDRQLVQAAHERAVAAGAVITQPLVETRVAYGFTALDPDRNQWWVHVETGFLDQLR